jgi:hypothetical protein
MVHSTERSGRLRLNQGYLLRFMVLLFLNILYPIYPATGRRRIPLTANEAMRLGDQPPTCLDLDTGLRLCIPDLTGVVNCSPDPYGCSETG